MASFVCERNWSETLYGCVVFVQLAVSFVSFVKQLQPEKPRHTFRSIHVIH